MNYNENKANVYAYYIYFPKCQNKNYTILNSINFNKYENEKEKLSNLFIVETNNYYFRLINPPDDYGYFTLNNFTLSGHIPIKDNNHILDFVVTYKDINNDIK